MTPRRRHLLLAMPATLVTLAVGAWLFWPRTAITPENAARIQPGMTLAEVEVILGGPARDESTGPLTADAPDDEEPRDLIGALRVMDFETADAARWRAIPVRSPPLLWRSYRLIVRVELDAAGRVGSSDSLPVDVADESPIDRLRRWLGL
jgi:hypothetical protein